MKIKYKMFSYLKFWLKSSNQHGLHSPFVYNYLTKGLYETRNLSGNKQVNWVLKSIDYFEPNKIYITSELQNEFSEYKECLTETISQADLIIVKNNYNDCVDEIIDVMNSKQLLLVCNQKYDSRLQKKMQTNENVVVLVDFYVGSLVSKRTEQLKQNFFLRL